jgi:8-oxo-dGTP pyrophosphatase MutT (NUDIX family)
VSAKEARPAATIIVARRGGKHTERGLELLMARRSSAVRFMPDVWVFPGGAVSPEDLEACAHIAGDDGEAAHRLCAARELEEEVGLDLGDDPELLAWSRWITPEAAPVRFDTRFYVALAPPHAKPEPDDEEVVEVRWITAADALAGHREGNFKLVFPTIKHLEGLLPYGSADELVAAAQNKEVEPILPRVVGTEESWRVVLPGDPEY